MRHVREGESRAVAGPSQGAATLAIPGCRASRAVAFPKTCDDAIISEEPVPQGGRGASASIPRKQPVSWSEPADVPLPGDTCGCCRGGRWWCETERPKGWRCWACHPPDHLRARAVRELRTQASPLFNSGCGSREVEIILPVGSCRGEDTPDVSMITGELE